MIINKSQINFETILNSYGPKTKLPFEENKHLFKKIAFDVYAPINDPSDNLWVIQDTDDGSFLIRTDWDHDNANIKESHDIGWNAITNKGGDVVTLYYKNLPLINLSADEYGFKKEDTPGFIKNLLSFMHDKENVAKLLKVLPERKVNAFLKMAALDFVNEDDLPSIAKIFEEEAISRAQEGIFKKLENQYMKTKKQKLDENQKRSIREMISHSLSGIFKDLFRKGEELRRVEDLSGRKEAIDYFWNNILGGDLFEDMKSAFDASGVPGEEEDELRSEGIAAVFVAEALLDMYDKHFGAFPDKKYNTDKKRILIHEYMNKIAGLNHGLNKRAELNVYDDDFFSHPVKKRFFKEGIVNILNSYLRSKNVDQETINKAISDFFDELEDAIRKNPDATPAEVLEFYEDLAFEQKDKSIVSEAIYRALGSLFYISKENQQKKPHQTGVGGINLNPTTAEVDKILQRVFDRNPNKKREMLDFLNVMREATDSFLNSYRHLAVSDFLIFIMELIRTRLLNNDMFDPEVIKSAYEEVKKSFSKYKAKNAVAENPIVYEIMLSIDNALREMILLDMKDEFSNPMQTSALIASFKGFATTIGKENLTEEEAKKTIDILLNKAKADVSRGLSKKHVDILVKHLSRAFEKKNVPEEPPPGMPEPPGGMSGPEEEELPTESSEFYDNIFAEAPEEVKKSLNGMRDGVGDFVFGKIVKAFNETYKEPEIYNILLNKPNILNDLFGDMMQTIAFLFNQGAKGTTLLNRLREVMLSAIMELNKDKKDDNKNTLSYVLGFLLNNLKNAIQER